MPIILEGLLPSIAAYGADKGAGNDRESTHGR